AQAEAELALKGATRDEREALLDEASRELRRVQTAATRGSSVERDLDAAQTALAAAQARLAQAEADIAVAEASLASARKRLDDMTIVAPFDGVVIDRVADLGEWAARGDTIVEMLDPNSVEIRLDVPERFVARLDPDTHVRVRLLSTGDEIDATVTHVIPDADVVSRLFPVRARVDTTVVKPGMSIVGLVPTGLSEPSLTIHKDAILRDDAGDKVYFDAGGRAAVARVSRLFAIGDRVAIRPGMVEAGMKLIVEGNERVFPGQPLQVVGGG
ncbi:MAG: efflux RND transporter periplasmic adaptor subunit, partial [Phycisphaerales bacterium]|nr:efflux RND transporter periplasmic adaptor subunit [Phycisphaerales bacterium]